MTKAKTKLIDNDMIDVIESSREMRKFLEDDNVSFEEKQAQLKIVNTKLKLNNNIVSASIVRVQIDKLANEN